MCPTDSDSSMSHSLSLMIVTSWSRSDGQLGSRESSSCSQRNTELSTLAGRSYSVGFPSHCLHCRMKNDGTMALGTLSKEKKVPWSQAYSNMRLSFACSHQNVKSDVKIRGINGIYLLIFSTLAAFEITVFSFV